MNELFASFYEWFGLMPYSRDMGNYLFGFDITCNLEFIGTPWYIIIGWLMIIITTIFYALQYYIIDSSRWNKKKHWWLFALMVFVLNYLIAFTIPFNAIKAGDYCNQLNLSVFDCIGFGLSNAIWSFLLFVLISTNPLFRRLSTNCRNTTFWKP
jgi:hypothetical protein